MALSTEERKALLQLARTMVERAARGQTKVLPEHYQEALEYPALAEKRGAFVTLKRKGMLRGCIGYVEGVAELAKAVADNAVSAATRDFRFPRVEEKEVPELKLEISALTPMTPMTDTSEIEIG